MPNVCLHTCVYTCLYVCTHMYTTLVLGVASRLVFNTGMSIPSSNTHQHTSLINSAKCQSSDCLCRMGPNRRCLYLYPQFLRHALAQTHRWAGCTVALLHLLLAAAAAAAAAAAEVLLCGQAMMLGNATAGVVVLAANIISRWAAGGRAIWATTI